jgi:hypothetical protein
MPYQICLNVLHNKDITDESIREKSEKHLLDRFTKKKVPYQINLNGLCNK